jgi:hypothetical protein
MDPGDFPQRLIIPALLFFVAKCAPFNKMWRAAAFFTGRALVVMTVRLQVLACKLKTFISHPKAFQRKSSQIGTFAGSLSLH